jgi:squalene synthase HpnC
MSTAVRSATEDLPTRDAVMAQEGAENFPVAALMLGRGHRRHLRAIYGYARLVDDVGDEADGDRLALLESIRADLACIYGGHQPRHPVMRALASTVHECRLPEEPFTRLLEANERDQVVSEYRTYSELLGYCQLSAAPVGELVLHVFGFATLPRIAMSDCVCAGLQIIEHLQDVAEDRARGRVYLPSEDLLRAGCDQNDLRAPSASQSLRGVIALLARRSRGLLDAGTPLLQELSPRPRLVVAGFIAGGRAALASIARVDYDVLAQTARPTRRGVALELVRVLGTR